MGYVYIAIILVMKLVQDIYNKKSSTSLNTLGEYLNYGAFRYILSALMALPLLFFMKNPFSVNLLTFAISFIAAISLVACMFCSLIAMKSGTVVLTALFGSAGLLLPIIAGIFLFNESISIPQYIGIILLLVSASLLIGCSRQIYKNFNYKTVLLLIGSMLSNGIIMVAQKMYSYYIPDGDVSLFSLLSFGIAGILLSIAVILYSMFQKAQKKGSPQQRLPFLPKNLIKYGMILSFALLLINQLSTVASAFVPSAILFSVVNGGGTIITSISAAIIFKEKINLKSGIGILIGILALIIINTL